MKKRTHEELVDYFAEIKPDEEYTEEDLKELRKEQMRIEKERKHRNKHAKLQTLLDVCAEEYNQDSH